MNAAGRLAAFTGVLALVTGGGALAGAALDPAPRVSAEGHEAKTEGHGASAGSPAPAGVRGLAVAANGLRLAVADADLQAGTTERISFRVLGADGATIKDFEVEHEKRMHLILVRRDLTRFQHLHPRQAPDGSWSVDAVLGDPGSYRLFADFTRGGRPETLATELRVDGAAQLRDLPAPADRAVTDGGYEVELDRPSLVAGEESELRFTVTKDGQPVETEPYLGAGGHLVVLRDGDLAFLHVHPTDEHGVVAFETKLPTQGRYRLFLQFQHEGVVETAAFTQEAK